MESQIWYYYPVTLCWVGLRKGKTATTWPLELCLEWSCPPALALMSDTSVSLHMPLVPFQLLPLYWNLKESISIKSKDCHGPFERRHHRILQLFLLPQSPLVISKKLWGLILLELEPWAGWLGVGLGSLAPEVSLPIFTHHMWVWNHPFLTSTSLHLCPSYLCGWIWLFKFLGCWTSI